LCVGGVEIADLDQAPRIDGVERARLLKRPEILRDLKLSGGDVLDAERTSRHEERRSELADRRHRVVGRDGGILELLARDDGRVTRVTRNAGAILRSGLGRARERDRE